MRDGTSLAPRGKDAFVEVNTAFLQGWGACARRQGCAWTCRSKCFSSACKSHYVAVHQGLWVRVEDGADATLDERYVSASDHVHLTDSLAEFSAGRECTRGSLPRAGRESCGVPHIADLTARAKSAGVYCALNLLCRSGGLTRDHVHFTHLMGEGVKSTRSTVYTLVEGQQRVDNHTLIEHAQPCTARATRFYKGIWTADDSIPAYSAVRF